MQAPRPNSLTLASPHNHTIKEVRKAIAKGSLTGDGYAIAEGFHLLDEALRSQCEIATVILAESAAGRVAPPHSCRVLYVTDELFQELSDTGSPQGVLALVRPNPRYIPTLTLAVILDGIQDPGNAGAIVRAAEAFGATAVIPLKGTVSLYNAKAMRASAGSIFRMPVLDSLDSSGITIYSARAQATLTVAQIDLRQPVAFVVGNEGAGVRSKLGTPVRIPTRDVESLNVAVAAGILLYEASRQRGGS